MTLTTLINALEDYLRPLIEAARGELAVVETEFDALEMLAVSPDKWRAVMCPISGDGGEADDDLGGYVTDTIQFILQAPKGLAVGSSKSLSRPKSNGTPSFLTRQQWLRQRVRGLILEDENGQIDNERGRTFRFKEWDWMKSEDEIWRASRERFTVRYILDDPAGIEEMPPVVRTLGGYVPVGGTPGQVFTKSGEENFAAGWADPAPGPVSTDPAQPMTLSMVDGYLHVTVDGLTKRFRGLDA